MSKECAVAEPLMAVDVPVKPTLALAEKVKRRILSLKPGCGPGVLKQCEILADAGLSPVQQTMIVDAVYAPTETSGSGQTIRNKWFVEALRQQHGGNLERYADNLSLFKMLVAEVEEMVEDRDQFNASSDVSVTFKEMFDLNSVGMTAKDLFGLMEDQEGSWVARKMRVMEAVRAVQAGRFSTVEGAMYSGANTGDFDDGCYNYEQRD